MTTLTPVASPLPAVDLIGSGVHLEVLGTRHIPGLIEAARPPRDSFRYTWVPEPDVDDVTRYVRTALDAVANGTALAFATVDREAGRVVGSTRFMNAEFWPSSNGHPSASPLPDAIEIGATWLSSGAQRTHVNTEAKILMLTHAFEEWRVKRVVLKTDARNAASRANIERIGASFEGVLRNHMYSADGNNGGLRDSATYSILATEWPATKLALQHRLRRHA